MRFLLLTIFLFFQVTISVAQDVSTLVTDARRLEAIPDEKAAFNKYKQALSQSPANIHLLVQCSELCSRIGSREPSTNSRDNYYKAAVTYARKALLISSKDDDANVAMAIAMGSIVNVKSGSEKIDAVRDIRLYADKALKANPSNFKAWHIIGKWNYEVSQLNIIERAATRVFFGGLPDASLTKAILAYEKARQLQPAFMLNLFELAKAYQKNEQEAKAIPLLKYLVTLPLTTEDDARIKTEARQLLKSWKA